MNQENIPPPKKKKKIEKIIQPKQAITKNLVLNYKITHIKIEA